MLLKIGIRQNKQNTMLSREESWCKIENEARGASFAHIPSTPKATRDEKFQL